MKNIAVLLAAGSGTRFGSDKPKQFCSVSGREILTYSLETFESHSQIDGIYIVCAPEYRHHVEQLVRAQNCTKVLHIVDGGKERYESTVAAIETCRADCAGTETPGTIRLLFHDAARPFVSSRIISDCILALETYQAAGTAVKTTDTVIVASADGKQLETVLDRTFLYNFQTPQCFYLPVIQDAYRRAGADPAFKTTDDCSTVRTYLPDIPVGIVAGDEDNFKITVPQDLVRAEVVMQKLTAGNLQSAGREPHK